MKVLFTSVIAYFLE